MKFAFNRTLLWILGGAFLVVNVAVFVVVFDLHAHKLKVSFLDIGQGDSILIQSPTGREILIDGGPDRSVLRELGKVLGPLDRNLDMVVETHPDKDHIFGLTPVFEQYNVNTFLEPGIPNDTNATFALNDAVAHEKGVEKKIARRGQRIFIGGGAYMDVLYPYQNDLSQMDTNDGSVTLHLVYGATSVLLSGDLPSVYEDKLIALDADDGMLQSDVLKAGHHGSKYSTDALWLKAVAPKILVVSAGKDNTYGHPSSLVLGRAARAGVEVVSTIQKGAVTFVSDGKTIQQK